MKLHLLLAGLLLAAEQAEAHHSTIMFDTTTPQVLRGTIVDVQFANPHSFIIVEVAGADGKPERWAVENSGTLAMTRNRGYDETNIVVGDAIAACGYAPKRDYVPRGEAELEAGKVRFPWLTGSEKVITGRLLLLKSGPGEHWSHYGPLELCQAALKEGTE